MFTIDPRLSSQSRIAKQKDYKTDVKFQTINTNLSGGLAIGSSDGKIRLYKQMD